jgi:hypothetical protein
MAKKAKKKAANPRRRPKRKTKPAEIPQPSPPMAREVTIDSVMRDLSRIKATLSGLL